MTIDARVRDGIYRIGTNLRPGVKPVKRSELKAGETIQVIKGDSVLFTVYAPPRKRDESPAAYWRRHGVVDDNFMRVHKGRYYCNPAHCRRSWLNKKTRDDHVSCAYGALG